MAFWYHQGIYTNYTKGGVVAKFRGLIFPSSDLPECHLICLRMAGREAAFPCLERLLTSSHENYWKIFKTFASALVKEIAGAQCSPCTLI